MRGVKAKRIRKSFFVKGIAITAEPYKIVGQQIYASIGRRKYRLMKDVLNRKRGENETR